LDRRRQLKAGRPRHRVFVVSVAFANLAIGHEYGGSAMLVLSRKTLESVMVGGVTGFEQMLKVTVLEINGRSVKLGFEADAAVPVHRLEVWARVRAGFRPGGSTAGPAAPVG
jgi:carbon storage regulator CsrA